MASLRGLAAGPLAPLYYLHGAEDVLKDEAVETIVRRALDSSLRDFNLDVRSAQSLDAADLAPLCLTLPMLAERRVVVIRDVEAWRRKTRARDACLAYARQPSPETVLVLVQGGDDEPDRQLAAACTTIACDGLDPAATEAWLAERARGAGVTFAPEALRHLVAAAGGDGLGGLRAELEKFAALPEGTVVTRELVGDLVGVRHGETATDWRDAVLDDDPPRALRLLPVVLAQAGASGVRLVTLLGTALVGLRIARHHLDRGARGRTLTDACFKALLAARPFGLGDWKAESAAWARWAPAWPPARLRAALRAVRDADRALKGTTLTDEQGVLQALVLALGPRRRAAA